MSYPPVETSHIHGAPERNPAQTPIADSVRKWGYLVGFMVMTVLANLLQKCLSMEYHRDVVGRKTISVAKEMVASE